MNAYDVSDYTEQCMGWKVLINVEISCGVIYLGHYTYHFSFYNIEGGKREIRDFNSFFFSLIGVSSINEELWYKKQVRQNCPFVKI